MFRYAELKDLNECFLPLGQRRDRTVFFCRIAGWSPGVEAFLPRYYDAARKSGVVIDGGIPNPDPKNLAYYGEMMGDAFRLEEGFLRERLEKWLPRMSPAQRNTGCAALFSTLRDMEAAGKTGAMIKNAYVKFMCWLYYKFERIVNRLGEEEPPPILYTGDPAVHELQLLTILSRAGSDVVLLEPGGDAFYQKRDPGSAFSSLYAGEPLSAFPPGFSLKGLQEALRAEQERTRLLGPPPKRAACTNAWMTSATVNGVLTTQAARGSDPGFFYNCFLLQQGAEDKLSYSGSLFNLYKGIRDQGRTVLVENGAIPPPTPAEIGQIRRENYRTPEHLAGGLSRNIQLARDRDLEHLMRYRFTELVLEEGRREKAMTRLTNRAVYLLCWLRRYQRELFGDGKRPGPPVFILFGGCGTEAEALFLRFLAALPVDVLVFQPFPDGKDCLAGGTLLVLRREETCDLRTFPVEKGQVRVRTAAYEASRDLDSLLYGGDAGLFRDQQHDSAVSVTLQTTYDEIAILWDKETVFRPHFAAEGGSVTIPVLLEKVCGVPDGRPGPYWSQIRQLLTPETVLIDRLPWIDPLKPNPMKPEATTFLRRGRLQRDRIMAHRSYPYRNLRKERQEYLLDKLQLLLDQRTIRGTYENGTEYTVIATALNLDRELIRLIHGFDFTKKNPKLVFLLCGEAVLSLEDSIAVALLNLIGFDVVFFVPTGYQCIESHFARPMAEEQQLGEYLYDLTPPDFGALPAENRTSFFGSIGKIFRKES